MKHTSFHVYPDTNAIQHYQVYVFGLFCGEYFLCSRLPGGYQISQERGQGSIGHRVRSLCAMLHLYLLCATARFLTVERGIVMLTFRD